MEQKQLVRSFLTLQDKGKISADVTMTDVTNWLMHSMSGLRLQQLPAIAKRCSAIEISPTATGRSVLNWTKKGTQMMQEVTKEVQREMRLERLWAVSKKEKGKRTTKSKKDSQDKDTEKHLGGDGEPNRSITSPSQNSNPKQISSTTPLTANTYEKGEDVNQDGKGSLSLPNMPCLQSPPYDSLDLMLSATANEKIYYSPQNLPSSAPLDRQQPFSDAKKKLSAVCQKLITEPTSPPTPPSSCKIIKCNTSTPQTLLEEHFKGLVTPEELQVVLQGIVLTLVEEVNHVLVPAIVAFEYARMLASSSPLVLPPCFAMSSLSSLSSKISPGTSSSLCTTPDVYVTYPDYTLPTCTEARQVEMASRRSSEDLWEDERHNFGKKVVAPTTSLLLKVENIIKDVIKDSVESFPKEMTLVNPMPTGSIAKDQEAEAKSGAKVKEQKPEGNTVTEVGVKTDAAADVFIDATDTSTAATTNTIAPTTDATIVTTSSKSDSPLFQKSPDNIENNTEQRLVAKDGNTVTEVGVKTVAAADVFIDATDTSTAATTNTTAPTTDATIVTTSSKSDSPLFQKSPDNIENNTEQRLVAKDVMNNCPEFRESDVSNMTEEEIHSDSANSKCGSDSGTGFVVSLEKSIWLSSKQVDEVLEKVSTILEEEWTYWSPPHLTPEPEGGHAGVEVVLPPPNGLIFASIQKMQLDKYLERKLMSFFAGQRISIPMSELPSPVDSFFPNTHENLPWSSTSAVSPMSIKVTKWLLQTIQRRNGWEGSMNSDLEGMDSRQVREKHILCEVIQALLDHLNNLSTTKSLSKKTQSESSLRPQGNTHQIGPVSADGVLSDMSLAASELTKDVMSKLLLEDSD
ncbi:hypothetical protein ACEWY4_024306 [Coilia grayii]|uniref:Uncharacterized protein n=1 Tax=Coilia grayii TaxID=363190 RepID=A0ABD1IZZ7_9TELE